ncbi:hypothetical protein ACFPYI_08645 [Halomarina salina]|uniref:DUF7995 domain-containing protein n=1 Tax=Halomarina salina TaxID=1872699 RepID=A0ABD5RM69_9EURY|nr:hypothetical protein [Halomarina salina]
MHQLIYALVEASTASDALARAHSVFDGLTGPDLQIAPVFDYYVTFDDDSSTVAGPARWGDLPTVVRADSPAGRRLIDRGWAATEREFQRDLARARDTLDRLSDADVMRDVELARYTCRRLGARRGPPISLYDGSGQGVRDRETLDRLLARERDADLFLWVVPADVHY